MNINVNLFDHVLHTMGLAGFEPSFVVIGAMDGISFDAFHNFVREYRWSGLLVEPMPEQFRRLITNYEKIGCSPNNKYENCAIADHNGTIQMLTIDQTAVDQGAVNACFGGMSAIYPPRNGLASEGDAETVQRFGRLVDVPCLTLASLFNKHQISALDVLCIDTEGWDFQILKQLDFKRWRPKLIRIEYINLSPEEKTEVASLLESHQYVYRIDGMDLDAVPIEYWKAMRMASRTVPRSAQSLEKAQGLTIVTSLLKLAADTRRGPDAIYEQAVQHLHAFNNDTPLLIYVAPGPTERAARLLSPDTAHVIVRRLEDIVAQEQFTWIEQALATSSASSASSALSTPSTALSSEAMAHWLSLCKPFLLNDATLYNPFGTGSFMWLDIDCLPVATEGRRDKESGWTEALRHVVNDARLWLPVTDQAPREDIAQLLIDWTGETRESLTFSAKANVLAGSRAAMNIFNGAYYDCLKRILATGNVCYPEHIFTILAYTCSYLFNPHAAEHLALKNENHQ